MNQFRERVIEQKIMRAAELTDNGGNWRLHPSVQRETLEGVLTEIGKVKSLTAYFSERSGGKLILIDGHLRRALDPDEEWRVDITDLTDAEADKLLLVLDPIAAMAEMDKQRVLALTDVVNTDDIAMRELLRKMELEARRVEDEDDEAADANANMGPPAMEVMPFEHHDYILLSYHNELDWLAAVETLGLDRRSDPRKTKKIGLVRVIDGRRIIERLRTAEEELARLKSAQKQGT